jgi:hypothetical protein
MSLLGDSEVFRFGVSEPWVCHSDKFRTYFGFGSFWEFSAANPNFGVDQWGEDAWWGGDRAMLYLGHFGGIWLIGFRLEWLLLFSVSLFLLPFGLFVLGESNLGETYFWAKCMQSFQFTYIIIAIYFEYVIGYLQMKFFYPTFYVFILYFTNYNITFIRLYLICFHFKS